MTVVHHFAARSLVVKESTAEIFKQLGIQHASASPNIQLPLPQNFSIRSEMTTVEDQLHQGSCTSFCVAACLEHLYQRDLSEAQIIHEAERAYGDCGEGLALVHAYQICKVNGSVDEATWPYDPNQTCWTTPPNLGGATRYRFGQIAYLYNRPRAEVLQEIKDTPHALSPPSLALTAQIQRQMFANRKPVSVSIPVVWSAWPWTGEVTMPSPVMLDEFAKSAAPPNTAGWHCIALCGWDNTTARFVFKNSWGGSWGNGGYGTIPYQYIERYSDVGMIGW